MASDNAQSSKKEITIKPSQLGPLMKAVWAAKRVPFLWGPPGIGKSDLLKQQANAMGVAYIDIRLATKNPSQIAGIPFPTEVHGDTSVRFSIPSEFPRDLDIEAVVDIKFRKRIRFDTLNPKGSNGIHYCQKPTITALCIDDTLEARIVSQSDDFFVVEVYDANGRPASGEVLYTINGKCRAVMCFDELSSANQSVQAVAYALINDRRLGEYEFPEGVDVVAAGNRSEDRGVSYELAQPLRNRFSHYTLEAYWKDWVAYSKLVAAYPAIIIMHEQNEGKCLFDFKPDSTSMAWPSPRSWMILSDIEYALDAANITDPILRLAAITGTIGTTHANTYQVFKDKFGTLPVASDIIAGRISGPPPKKYDPASAIWLSTSIVWLLRNRLRELVADEDAKDVLKTSRGDAFYESANNAFRFMMDNFPPDLIAGQVRNMSMKYKLPLDPRRMPAFEEYMSHASSTTL